MNEDKDMNRDFENENENLRENHRGRSRRKGASGAGSGYTGTRVSRMAAEGPAYEGTVQGHKDWAGSRLHTGRPGKDPDKKKDSHRRDKKPSWRPLIIVLIILEIFIMLGIGAVRYVKQMESLVRRDESVNMENMTNSNLTNDEYIQTMQGYWTIALFGVDSRNGSLGKGNNSDVNIICNVNMDTGEIKLVSVYRDTYLNIDNHGSYNKINQAYLQGGADQAIQALNRNLDLQMDDYATFNWKAVVDAINILGGVDIELSKAEFYYINAYITETVKATGVGSHQLTHAGMNHLDGVQAVAYARLRYMDTDFARTERQRKVIQLAFDKLKAADFATINNVMETVLGQIETSVTLDDLIPAAKNITKYHISETTGFPQARTDANMGRKGACVIPATLTSNVTSLHEFLFGETGYEPSDQVKEISAKISSDSGRYQEATPIESVGTDGGYIPKPTEAAQEDSEETTAQETKEGETLPGHTLEDGLIDGEYPWDLELETDEDGNYLDPPEYDYPIDGSQLHPGMGETLEGDDSTGPGVSTETGASLRPVRPGQTQEAETSGSSGIMSNGPTDIPSEDELTGPGVSPGGSSTSGTAPAQSSPETSASSGFVSPIGQTTAASPNPLSQPAENSQSGPQSVIVGPAGN